MSGVLKVVCTDRGAHKRLVLGELLLMGDGLGGPQRVGLAARNRPRGDESLEVVPPEVRPHAGVKRERGDGGRWFTFTCPRCGRESRLRDDRLMQATESRGDGKIRWSVSHLDISHLGS